jgi:hypothetical protein
MLLLLGGLAMQRGGLVSTACSCSEQEAAHRLTIADLRNLAAAQQQFRARHRVFARDIAALGSAYRPSSTDLRLSIEYADSTVWRARASYSGVAGTCMIEGGAPTLAAAAGTSRRR